MLNLTYFDNDGLAQLKKYLNAQNRDGLTKIIDRVGTMTVVKVGEALDAIELEENKREYPVLITDNWDN